MYSGTFVLTKIYSATSSRKKKNKKSKKKKKGKCGCRESFHWFAANFLQFFVHFKALTLPAEVWRFAEPFGPAEAPPRSKAARAPSALPRRSRLQNGRQPSHTHCVYIFCVSFSRSFYSVRVLARMHVWCSQLTSLFFTPPRKRVASHRKCYDPSVRHVSSGRKRCVRETICCCFCFLSTLSLVFWVVHIFWYCLPSPNQHRLSPRFYVTFISHIVSNTSSCCWNAVFYVAYVVHETELVYVETIAFVIVDLVFFSCTH